jgi:hypothetical protein
MFYKIRKKTNLISFVIEEIDNHPCFYYVEIKDKISKKIDNSNKLYFDISTKLNEKELGVNPLIKDIKDGKIRSTYTDKEFEKIKKDNYNHTVVGLETFNLIKNWCREQPEGCEEAFICLGIDDKFNKRYLEYLNKKIEIKKNQNSKKLK